jgi:hypothetical protein
MFSPLTKVSRRRNGRNHAAFLWIGLAVASSMTLHAKAGQTRSLWKFKVSIYIPFTIHFPKWTNSSSLVVAVDDDEVTRQDDNLGYERRFSTLGKHEHILAANSTDVINRRGILALPVSPC